MKYFIPIAFFTVGLFVSCSNESNIKIQAEREQAQKINDSILNAIYNNWNYNLTNLSTNTVNQTKDWGAWHSFMQEIKQKPSKSISAYVAKVDNLTRISDEMLLNIPVHLNEPQVSARLNNLNTNIKYLNSFISLQIIPLDKVYKVQNYIVSDINAINYQIDELVRIKNIPTEKGEQEMLNQIIDTTRRANFNFENQVKQNMPAPNEPVERGNLNRKPVKENLLNARPSNIPEDV
jgi:hypothetical protein